MKTQNNNSTLTTKEQYERTERMLFNQRIQEVESAPINQDDVTELYEAMTILEIRDCMDEIRCPLQDRISWLIAGNYGKGSYDATMDVIRRPRMNREAWIMQTIGALEYHVKSSQVRELWHKLTDTQKFNLNRMIQSAMSEVSA